MKHDKDISRLNEEVIMLKNLVQNLALQLIKTFSKEGESNEKKKKIKIIYKKKSKQLKKKTPLRI